MTHSVNTPQRLRQARESLGLTQAELAEALGLAGWNSISKMERGERPIEHRTDLAVRYLLRHHGE